MSKVYFVYSSKADADDFKEAVNNARIKDKLVTEIKVENIATDFTSRVRAATQALGNYGRVKPTNTVVKETEQGLQIQLKESDKKNQKSTMLEVFSYLKSATLANGSKFNMNALFCETDDTELQEDFIMIKEMYLESTMGKLPPSIPSDKTDELTDDESDKKVVSPVENHVITQPSVVEKKSTMKESELKGRPLPPIPSESSIVPPLPMKAHGPGGKRASMTIKRFQLDEALAREASNSGVISTQAPPKPVRPAKLDTVNMVSTDTIKPDSPIHESTKQKPIQDVIEQNVVVTGEKPSIKAHGSPSHAEASAVKQRIDGFNAQFTAKLATHTVVSQLPSKPPKPPKNEIVESVPAKKKEQPVEEQKEEGTLSFAELRKRAANTFAMSQAPKGAKKPVTNQQTTVDKSHSDAVSSDATATKLDDSGVLSEVTFKWNSESSQEVRKFRMAFRSALNKYLAESAEETGEITIDKRVTPDIFYDALSAVVKTFQTLPGFPPRVDTSIEVDFHHIVCESSDNNAATNPLVRHFETALDCHLNNKPRPIVDAPPEETEVKKDKPKPKPSQGIAGPNMMSELQAKLKEKIREQSGVDENSTSDGPQFNK